MAMNLVEKILLPKIIAGEPVPGNEVSIRIDQTLTQDATGAFERLTALLKRTAGDDRTRVRTRLIELFELFDPADPDVIAGRRNLANALY